MSQGARLQDCTVLCGSGGPHGYLGSASYQIPDGTWAVCLVDDAVHTDTVAEEYGLVETEPSEASPRLSDVIMFALPGGDSHGKIDNLINALTLESRGWGPGRQAIPDVWEDQALNQRFGGGSGKHVPQLVDRDE